MSLIKGQYSENPPVQRNGEEAIMQTDPVGNQKLSLATVLEYFNDSVTAYLEPWDNKAPISASAAVMAAPGVVGGFVINSFTDGAVITIYDNASAASGTALATVTLGANNYSGQVITLSEVGITAVFGVYFAITVAAANITPLTRLA